MFRDEQNTVTNAVPISIVQFFSMKQAMCTRQWKNPWRPNPFDRIDKLWIASTIKIALWIETLLRTDLFWLQSPLILTMVKQSCRNFQCHHWSSLHTWIQRRHRPKCLLAYQNYSNTWCEKKICKCYSLSNRHCQFAGIEKKFNNFSQY